METWACLTLGVGAACWAAGWIACALLAGRSAPPEAAPAPASHFDPERRAGCTPAAPYLIIRADDPGAPLEVQSHE